MAYSGTRYVAQSRPPTCPKCGSHRTEIVGSSRDTRTVVVRCNACGERSPVINNEVSARIFNTPVAEAAH